MLKVTTRLAEPEDAQRFFEIAARAFAGVPEHARPKDRPEFVAHTHGAANPAGRAWIALAEDGGAFVGHVSAIPFRFHRRDRSTVLGWQIGCYVVDASRQGRGVGHAILDALQGAVLRSDASGFVYTYPNARSLQRFLKLGGRETARAPARIVMPARPRGTVRDGSGAVWRVAPADADAARRELEARADPEPAPGSFLRDKAFFRWRFLAEPAAPRYRFAVAERGDGNERILLALGEHTVHGRSFAILVDAFPDVSRSRLASAVALARAAGVGRPVYLTTNMHWSGRPFSIRVPRRFDPRPVVGVLMPGRDGIEPDFAAAPILTGDWMGF